MAGESSALPVFRAAATAEVREDYLQHYERRKDRTREQLALAAGFLRSDACIQGLEHLRRSDAALPVPAKTQTERNGKLRDIYSLPPEDALLLGLLNHALHIWDDRFSPALCSNILCRGKSNAFVRIRQTPEFGSLYLFSADVRAYGDSIDGELLSAALCIPPRSASCPGWIRSFSASRSG